MEAPGILKPGKIILIVLITLGGSVFVFGSMIAMNRSAPEPAKKELFQIVSFTVAPPPPPATPREQPREETLKRSAKLSRNLAVPAPGGSSNLSGINISLPGFSAESIGASAVLSGDLENVALTEDTVDEKPVPRSTPIPVYPERAKQRSIEGRVLASVLVGTDGRVKNLAILESAPAGVFDAAVEAALKNWIFEPAKYKGQPVQTWVNIPFPFRLN